MELTFNSKAVESNQYYYDTTVLGEIGRSNLEKIGRYNTNPYTNDNNYQNSLMLNIGGISNNTIIASRYSNQTYSNNSNNEANQFKLTSNYGVAYLRKVSDNLSLGIEISVFNVSRYAVNENLLAAKINAYAKQQNPDFRLSLNYGDDVCSYNPIQSQAVQDFCNDGGGKYTTCSLLNFLWGDLICDGAGYVNNVSLCNNLPSEYSYLCSNGVLNEAQFCSDIIGGQLDGNRRCIFNNGNTINQPNFCDIHPADISCQPTPPDICDTNPNDPSCLPPPDICDIDPNDPSCSTDPGGGGNGSNNTSNNISITSNSYTAMFLANYEVYRTNYIGLSIESGIGANYREMQIRGAVSGGGANTVLTGKIGIIGSYYFADNFALGIGTHYLYLGEHQFKELGKTNNFSGYDFIIKSSATIAYNLQLRYFF